VFVLLEERGYNVTLNFDLFSDASTNTGDATILTYSIGRQNPHKTGYFSLLDSIPRSLEMDLFRARSGKKLHFFLQQNNTARKYQ